MIDRGNALPLVARAQQLDNSRGSIHYLPRPASPAEPDDHVTNGQTAPALYVRWQPDTARSARAVSVGSLHVATVMKRVRDQGDLPPAEHVKAAPGHKIYPYLLRKLTVIQPNQRRKRRHKPSGSLGHVDADVHPCRSTFLL